MCGGGELERLGKAPASHRRCPGSNPKRNSNTAWELGSCRCDVSVELPRDPRIHFGAQHLYLGVEIGSLKLPDSWLNASEKSARVVDAARRPPTAQVLGAGNLDPEALAQLSSHAAAHLQRSLAATKAHKVLAFGIALDSLEKADTHESVAVNAHERLVELLFEGS